MPRALSLRILQELAEALLLSRSRFPRGSKRTKTLDESGIGIFIDQQVAVTRHSSAIVPNEGSFPPARPRKLSGVCVVFFFAPVEFRTVLSRSANVSRCHRLLEDFVYSRIRATKMFPRSYVRSNFNRSNFKYVCIRCIRGKCFYQCKKLLRRMFRENVLVYGKCE